MLAGAGVSSLRSDGGGRPSDSADRAGASSSDRFAEILGHLSRMTAAMPALGSVGNQQWQIAHGAESMAGDSARLRAGDVLPVDLGTLETRAAELEAANRLGDQALSLARDEENRVLVIKNQSLVVPRHDATTFENQLWTAWMASLTGGSNEMLDNDVIEEYLGPRGKRMLDFGSYTSDADQAEAVTAAQRRWLQARGIEPPTADFMVLSQYRREHALDRLRATVVGREGVLRDPGHITIGTQVYHYPQNAGAFPTGTRMVALHVVVAPHRQGEVNIERWDNDCFHVYCNPVTPRSDVPVGAP